jgi:hypothetical protein
MKPNFQLLIRNYPRDMREPLFTEIGWTDLIDNKTYWDTCAIRMSVGLLRVGMVLPGARMKANAGSLKSKYIEPGQAKLSNILKGLWGAPEVYKGKAAAQAGIGRRTGVVSFFQIEGGQGGHIDLIWRDGNDFHACARSCYFSAVTVWFWPLQ